MTREQIATLIKASRSSTASKTLCTSPALNTAAAVASDRLTSIYSDSDLLQVIIELGAEESSITLDDSPIG